MAFTEAELEYFANHLSEISEDDLEEHEDLYYDIDDLNVENLPIMFSDDGTLLIPEGFEEVPIINEDCSENIDKEDIENTNPNVNLDKKVSASILKNITWKKENLITDEEKLRFKGDDQLSKIKNLITPK